ncbi:response regulator [Lentisalinibacter orientalis]|uniref:response regulator n=1 Tax=Lentisalinibacter orientalis TaxID=2992241 RepID=UPI0038674A53
MAQTARIDTPDDEPGGKPKVLFVDDEKRVLNSMRALFRRDYELHLTTDGAEAIRIAEQESVDVIIADQRMPGLSGVEVLGEVRRRAPSAVRILLTGYADLDAIEGSINIGEVFRFLSKPCPPQELRETLAEAVQAARQSGAAVRAATVLEAAPAPPQPERASEPEAAPQYELAPESEPEPRPGTVPPAAEEPAPRAVPAEDHAATVPNLALELEREEPPRSEATAGVAEEKPAEEAPVETEIVLSGDSGTEFVDTIVIGGDEAPGSRRGGACEDMDNVGVALFTSDATFADSVERTLGERYRVTRASTLVQVTEMLSDAGAGVLVTDFCTDGAMLRNMLSTLKRYLPELITIVVSDERDAAEMISLINHGQVFRYMSKPMDEARLVQNVNAAILRHIQLLENPELVQRHSVVPDRPPRHGAAMLAQFVSRIRGMRRLWVRS